MLRLVLLAAALAGCAGAQIGLPAGARGPADISQASVSKNLLYVTDVGTDSVYVYTYPSGKLIDTLTGFKSPVRDCSDSAGNVYVTNTESEQVLEFPHAGKVPVATFNDPGYLPWDCSADPTSDALAVTAYGKSGSNTGSVAIFTGRSGLVKLYHARGVQAYLFCAYDNQGNLFVDGLDFSYNFVLIELRKGARKFQRVTLHQHFGSWGGLQWDGRYLAIGDGTTAIYDFAIAGMNSKRVRAVPLKGSVDVAQFWLDGAKVIAPDGPNGAKHDVGLWKYPQGGNPTNVIGKGLFRNPSSATVSTVP